MDTEYRRRLPYSSTVLPTCRRCVGVADAVGDQEPAACHLSLAVKAVYSGWIFRRSSRPVMPGRGAMVCVRRGSCALSGILQVPDVDIAAMRALAGADQVDAQMIDVLDKQVAQTKYVLGDRRQADRLDQFQRDAEGVDGRQVEASRCWSRISTRAGRPSGRPRPSAAGSHGRRRQRRQPPARHRQGERLGQEVVDALSARSSPVVVSSGCAG
jgi:hypothetical protein